MKNIGLIDVDVLVYRSCHKALRDNTSPLTEFDKTLDEVMTHAGSCDYELHLSGKGNFRKDVNAGFTREYKGKRKSKPVGYNQLREYITSRYDTITVPLFEADDTIAISATRIQAEGNWFTVISVDKDLKQLGGFFFNTRYNSMEHNSEESGLNFFNKQLLMGDAVDNIEGLFGVGIKKAEKLFKDKNLTEQLDAVIELYKEYHPEDWKMRLEYMGTMLWMKRSFDEPNWTIESYRTFLQTK